MRAVTIAVTIAVVAVVAAARDVSAQWIGVAPGVDRLEEVVAGPNRVRATRIDLCAPGVRMRATTSAERGQKTSSWASSLGLAAAVNGGFFLFGGYVPDQCVVEPPPSTFIARSTG